MLCERGKKGEKKKTKETEKHTHTTKRECRAPCVQTHGGRGWLFTEE